MVFQEGRDLEQKQEEGAQSSVASNNLQVVGSRQELAGKGSCRNGGGVHGEHLWAAVLFRILQQSKAEKWGKWQEGDEGAGSRPQPMW